ncbi:hypothetical protein FDP22_09640 [Paroceanicella profunda]|uniref:Uncharacterized protein n=1 Tax=Paroceanicella profunda TaxID=2579971 RepID=A0A5B8FWS9_9RHOB|nr:hypothetical protein [Paroceanicella profunda]QDL92014.1 hypothetical protein FDP22_09640 [Paroceanicella profunda]
MRSPYSRLAGETPPAIGHNQGPPLDPATSWRRHCWGAARKSLVGTIPLEVVRRRVRRARELGLDYPAYASILLGTGRDIVGFLFTCEAIGLRLQRTVSLPLPVTRKLGALERCERLLMTDRDTDPARLSGLLEDELKLRFAGTGPEPEDASHPAAGRAAIRALLDPLNLPGDAVVMIGTRAEERDWAEAARLAKFMAAPGYFGTNAA